METRLPSLAWALLFTSALPAAAAAPPNSAGQLIAFTSAGLDGDGFGGIWLVRPDGTGFKQLTSFANPIFELDDLHGLQLPEDHPTVSPNGKQIAFVSNRGHAFNKELYLMDVNGANSTFANPWVAVDLGQSSLTTSGPEGRTVTMRLALTLSALTACQQFRVQLFASDDHGNAQGFDDAGTLSSGDCAPHLTGGDLLFRYPTEPEYRSTVESREALSSDPGAWADRATTTGDGSIHTYHEPAGGTQRFFRLRVTAP